MKIVATKRAHPTIERLGYLQAVLIENESGWDLADEKNLALSDKLDGQAANP